MNDLEQDEELRELIRKGRKIQGIKLVRERTGMGLKDAKEAFEELERKVLEAEECKPRRAGAGCGSGAVLLAAALGAGAAALLAS